MHAPKFLVPLIALLLTAAALAGNALQTATNFVITCATTPTPIASPDGGFNGFYCQNMSATSVFLGGSAVTTTTAPCISTTSGTCAKPDFSWDVSQGATPSCVVASGTVALKCISGK